jgi:hypothetical protein
MTTQYSAAELSNLAGRPTSRTTEAPPYDTPRPTLIATEEWLKHRIRAALHLMGAGAVCGPTGAEVPRRMQMFNEVRDLYPD